MFGPGVTRSHGGVDLSDDGSLIAYGQVAESIRGDIPYAVLVARTAPPAPATVMAYGIQSGRTGLSLSVGMAGDGTAAIFRFGLQLSRYDIEDGLLETRERRDLFLVEPNTLDVSDDGPSWAWAALPACTS
jgi:hypothetical protein